MENQTKTHKLIVGLGNPGVQFFMTRHNMGYLVVDELAKRLNLSWKLDKRMEAYVAKGIHEDVEIHLLKPTTFMNLSGVAVKKYLLFYKLTPEDLIVVSDDVATPFGQIRLKPFGGPGGHNGLKNIESSLGTNRYIRLRVGIGDRQNVNDDLADHVLAHFHTDERAKLPEITAKSAEILRQLLVEEIQIVMNRVNRSSEITDQKKEGEKI